MAQTDRDALIALYDATGGDHWVVKENWNTGAALSQWDGVQVNSEGRVVRLSLPSNNLSGTWMILLDGQALLAFGVVDLPHELVDRKWPFHKITVFTAGHNVATLPCPARGLRLNTPHTKIGRSTNPLCVHCCRIVRRKSTPQYPLTSLLLKHVPPVDHIDDPGF
ncbi:unnamed protein product [Ectocarpus sp. 8 AP-2014]